MYVVDGNEQVVYWQLISVAENRSQRIGAAASLESGTVVRIRRNLMPLEENLPCNKGRSWPTPTTERYVWQGDDSSTIQSHMLLNADYGGPLWCLLTTCTLSTLAPPPVHPSTRNVELFVLSPKPGLDETFVFRFCKMKRLPRAACAQMQTASNNRCRSWRVFPPPVPKGLKDFSSTSTDNETGVKIRH